MYSIDIRLAFDKIIKSGVYPTSFITPSDYIAEKTNDDVSADGTPRYLVNPNSNKSYSILACLESGWKPIFN